MKQVFEGDLDIERLVLAISAETGVSIEAENTLIIFDEIQEVPKALTSLKYFHENAPQYAIVAAGSLLGVALHQGTSFPVGKVDFLDLYPLNFREFLCAMGEKQFVSMLDSCDTQMVTVFKTKYIERLREYYFVGGMPEVVKDFSEKKDYNRVRAIQKNLINYYQQDFSKHAEIKLVPRLNLKAYIDFDAFKLFLVDIGLLIAMTDLDAKVIIEGNKIFTEFKGALTEQYILQQLISDVGVIPYYYSTQNSKGEIDFLVQGKTSVIPIEVKAEENLKAKSLKAFCEKYQPSYAVRTSMSDYREQDWMTNIPLYAVKWIKNYVNQ